MSKSELDKTQTEQMLSKNSSNSLLKAKFIGTQRKPLTLDRNKRSHAAKVKKFLKQRLQILNWIGDYNIEWGVNDLIAGITLGLTIIPESIACALLAGLPAQYGLCSAFMGSFVYILFGSIHKVIIGPTSLVALVSLQFTVGKPVEFAILLTFFTGIVELIMGSLRLGFIFEFLSMPVIKAFSSATAILVIESQVKVMCGIKYLVPGFIQSIIKLTARIGETNVGDLLMGIFAMLFLISFEHLEKLAYHPKIYKPLQICFKYLSFSRNTLVVIITAAISYVWMAKEHSVPYSLSQNALSGLPNFTLPDFTVVTPEHTYNIWEVLSELNIGIIVIPIVGILTNISIGKLTPKGLVDSNQELLTVGVCNIFGSCVQSMPLSGAFSRYAISSACGLRTPMANLYSGTIVLLALSFLSPYFNYIPQSTLAAILMCSIVTLLDLKLPRRLWNESKRDFCIWMLCFTVCIFFGVVVGLLVSVIVTVLHLLSLWARPEVTVKIGDIDEMQYISVTPGNGIYFPAINHFREKVMKACVQTEFRIPVVVDCLKVTGLDYTAAQGISKLSGDLNQPAEVASCPKGEEEVDVDPDGAFVGDIRGDSALGGGSLLILYRMQSQLQRLIDITENLVYCDNEETIREFLTQEQLRNGHIQLKPHIRASIDLGYKVDVEGGVAHQSWGLQ